MFHCIKPTIFVDLRMATKLLQFQWLPVMYVYISKSNIHYRNLGKTLGYNTIGLDQNII